MLTGAFITKLIIGLVINYAVGAFWYSPKLFGKAWMQEQPHRKPEEYQKSAMAAMIVQAVYTLLLGIVLGILLTRFTGGYVNVLMLALMILFGRQASGLFLGHSNKMVYIDQGYTLLMIIVYTLAFAL